MENSNTPPYAGQMVLHLGANKTGSTALQNMLYNNKTLLRDYGIHYRDSKVRNPVVQSGNGEILCNLITQGGSKNEIKRTLLHFYNPERLSIVSSEMFVNLTKQQWNLLFECFAELELQVKLLVFVRSPLDFYVSNYNQAIKRHGEFSDLETYIQKSGWLHFQLLQNLNETNINAEIKVVPFESIKFDLIQSFWKCIFEMSGVDVRGLIAEDQILSNRSLYEEEIQMMRRINAIFSTKESVLVSKFLVEDSNFTGTKMVVPRTAAKMVFDKHKHDVLWINNTFFSSENVLSIDYESYPIDDLIFPLETYPDSAMLVQLILYLLRNPRDEVQKSLPKKVDDFISNFDATRYEERMPDGSLFDNVYYLVKNPDVMSSGISPLEHFNNWGRDEGRIWRTRDLSHLDLGSE